MPLLNIIEFPDPRLRTKALPIEKVDGEIVQLAKDMLETMYAAPGIGLAATQVNIHRRLVVVDVSDDRDNPHVLINPEIVEQDGKQVCEEGCLSVPGIYAKVDRADWIKVRAQDIDGESRVLEADDLLAVCIQHELDHLNGKLFVDYLSPLKQARVRKKLEKARRLEASA
ncbi:MAG: peptide deformylase [Lysobacterales bacterium]